MASYKYGDASTLEYGTKTDTNFDIVESITEEKSYQTESLVKDENGATVGLVLADERGTYTISGMTSATDVAAAGNITLGNALAITPDLIASAASLYITSIRSTRSNTDFQRFEITAVGFDAVSGAGTEIT
jgi:hypothetical protein